MKIMIVIIAQLKCQPVLIALPSINALNVSPLNIFYKINHVINVLLLIKIVKIVQEEIIVQHVLPIRPMLKKVNV